LGRSTYNEGFHAIVPLFAVEEAEAEAEVFEAEVALVLEELTLARLALELLAAADASALNAEVKTAVP